MIMRAKEAYVLQNDEIKSYVDGEFVAVSLKAKSLLVVVLEN